MPHLLIAHIKSEKDGRSERLGVAMENTGAVALALPHRPDIATLEGVWPGGTVGLWRIPDIETAHQAVVAAGPLDDGDFAISVAEIAGVASPVPGAGILLVQGIFTDPVKAAAYNKALPPIYEKYGGHYLALARLESVTHLAGKWEPTAIVIALFSSVSATQTFWHSPEYAAAKKLRQGGGRFLVATFPGVSA